MIPGAMTLVAMMAALPARLRFLPDSRYPPPFRCLENQARFLRFLAFVIAQLAGRFRNVTSWSESDEIIVSNPDSQYMLNNRGFL